MDGDQSLGIILVDAPPGEGADFDRSIFERFDHPVDVCAGPGPGERCPLLAGAGCPMADEAHGIVFSLDLDEPGNRAILAAYLEQAPDRPIRVVCSEEQARRHAAELASVEVWVHDPTVADLDGFAAHVEAADRVG